MCRIYTAESVKHKLSRLLRFSILGTLMAWSDRDRVIFISIEGNTTILIPEARGLNI